MSWAIAGRYVRAAATDPDAQAYLQAVEAADGQALEFEVARAIDNFVLGCKADGIWAAIKASCILAGARTLAGALVPLVGTAPTNFNFDSGDYNRKTGLTGDGSTKSLNSNRSNNADPQDNNHNAVFPTTVNVVNNHTLIGSTATAGFNNLGFGSAGLTYRVRSQLAQGVGVLTVQPNALVGVSRGNGTQSFYRVNQISTTRSDSSTAPSTESIFVFGRASAEALSTSTIAFYSIGESLDLALLDARVTALINAFDAAI